MATERYHPFFAVDLATACSYYDSIASTLGNRFRANVRSAIRNIVDRPDSFGRIGGDFRAHWLTGFLTLLFLLLMMVFPRSMVCVTPRPIGRIGSTEQCHHQADNQ